MQSKRRWNRCNEIIDYLWELPTLTPRQARQMQITYAIKRRAYLGR